MEIGDNTAPHPVADQARIASFIRYFGWPDATGRRPSHEHSKYFHAPIIYIYQSPTGTPPLWPPPDRTLRCAIL
jgi:hypothetical protein